MKNFTLLTVLTVLLGAVSAQSTTNTGSACVVPTTGPAESKSDKSRTVPTFVSSGSAHPSNAATAASTAATTTGTSPTPSPSSSPPYVPGTCSFHMTQWQSLADSLSNNGVYGCEIRILDDNKTTIGWQPHTQCSTAKPLTVNSKLESGMVITPESAGDYIQFTVGSQSWASTKGGTDLPNCSVGKWDGSDDPRVSILALGRKS